MRTLRLCVVCIISVFVLPVQARVWSADDVPMVHLQDRNRYVSDPDQLMTPAMRDSADSYLGRLHHECGVQTVFVVVSHVKDGDCFRMAQDIGNRYGVGDKKDRRGLVIVIAVGDRRYFIAPGKGLEGDLTDIESDQIARACIVKNMKINQIDEAVAETSRAIYLKLKTGKTGLQDVAAEEEMTAGDVLLMLFLIMLFFGGPMVMFVRVILESWGLIKKSPRQQPNSRQRKNRDDDWMPPFIFGGGGGFGGGGSIGGSFGGGSFGGGGAGGSW